MAQTSFDVDANTQRALEELKQFFGVKTNAGAIKRALALAQVASENVDEKKRLTILDKTNNVEKVVIMADGL